MALAKSGLQANRKARIREVLMLAVEIGSYSLTAGIPLSSSFSPIQRKGPVLGRQDGKPVGVETSY